MKDHHAATVKRQPVKPPTVSGPASLAPVNVDQIVNDAMLECVHLDDVNLTGFVAGDVHVQRAEITRGTLVDAELERLRLTDVRIADADWSNIVLFNSGWTRVAATGMKILGARLNESSLRDVSLEDCLGELLQVQMAKFARVRFVRCRLRGAMFNGSDLSGCVFDACDLRDADFSQSNLSGADVRRSDLAGVHLGPDQLRGLIVTPDQALYLAGAIGLNIKA